MTARAKLLFAFAICLSVPGAVRAETDVTLFRVFFLDGTSVVSYGELARVGEQVIFSMPVGGPAADPRLHPVSLPADVIDWPRTERYAVSARYQQYLATRAESDYQRLSDEVAALLNDVAMSTDRARALDLAEQARQALADWPRRHFGYRQHDVRDIVALLDGAISRLRGGSAANRFDVSLVALADPIEVEPVAAMPTGREQLEQVVRVLTRTTSAADRVALMQSGLAMLADGPVAVVGDDITAIRRSFEQQLREEAKIDRQYARFSEEVFAAAARAASAARIADVQRVLTQIPKRDAKLGQRRPGVVQALTGSVQAKLEGARRLRLLRDQWTVRRSLFRDYERSVDSDLEQLTKALPLLEAIRTLEGPEPDRLATLRSRLSGGAARLQRLSIPDYLQSTHALLVGAWRFAETAANGRMQAIASGNLATAWEASSAAAGALMLLSRAQQEIRVLLEPPTLK
jgi:hypothetical protein